MQSEAIKLTAFTAVAGALGFLLRWLQILRIIDPDTGLAQPGAGISYIVAGLIVVIAIILGVASFLIGRHTSPETAEEALGGEAFLYRAISLVPTVLLALSGVVQILQANAAHWPEGQITLHLILGAATLAAAAGAFLIAAGVRSQDKKLSRQLGAGLLILFGGLWLIVSYKSAASDPVIWRYAVEILAICGALLAVYHVAGFFFDEPTPRAALFFCYFGAFLCIMSAVDEHPLAETLSYAAMAVQLLVWGYRLTANHRRGRQTPKAEAAEM